MSVQERVIECGDPMSQALLPANRNDEIRRHQGDAQELHLAVGKPREEFAADPPVINGERMLVRSARVWREQPSDTEERVMGEWFEKHGATTGSEYSSDLGERPSEIEVMKNRGAHDQVERVVLKARPMRVLDPKVDVIGIPASVRLSPRIRDLAIRDVDTRDRRRALSDQIPRLISGSATV